MNWSNVKLILAREIRDQLRDRRTLFMIFVLPILLYPLLGMSFLQVAQFMEEKPSRVLIVGARNLPKREDSDAADPHRRGLPPLLVNNRFNVQLFSDPAAVRRFDLRFARDEPPGDALETPDPRQAARRAVRAGECDAAVCFPPEFAGQLEAFRRAIEEGDEAAELKVRPEIIYSTANERSQIAFVRLSAVLERWSDALGEVNLASGGMPISAAKPFRVQTADVAADTGLRGAAVWSKVLPVLLLIWAMTGAFYPAIDLCAGEKERGTLETLLASPAERSEIVLGKLLTIMIFSMATAVLNLVSMGLTGWLVLAQLPAFGPPPAMAAVWLSIALVPVSALFSALCLALAAFARSTKEGQYYLMPLLLVTMPLVVLPMAPGVELNLGNSLIPVTGVVLLLRSMLEGNVLQDWPFVLPVTAVTLSCCLLAIRWAVDQFNSESVLFREGERLDVRLWVRHLLEDRGPTPAVAEAVFCGVAILLVRFFMSFALPQPDDFAHSTFRQFAVLTAVTQLAAVLTPALLMTVMLTSSPRKTLLLRRPPPLALPAAVLLAVLVHPAVQSLQVGVTLLYPPTEASREMLEKLQEMILRAPVWQALVVLAVMPAVCEELAFRGFILSGFRHLGHKWRAIFYAALFFGVSHLILQQSIIACVVGVLIGYLAVQSGSILPGVLFHFIHNALGLVAAQVSAKLTPQVLDGQPLLAWLVSSSDGGMTFRWPVIMASAAAALAVLLWFHRLPYPKSPEEERHEAILRALQTDCAEPDRPT